MRIAPNNGGLGARVLDLDLAAPLSAENFRGVLRALGEYGVLCFPDQDSMRRNRRNMGGASAGSR